MTWIDSLVALVGTLGLVAFVWLSAPFLRAIIFPPPPRAPEEILEEALREAPLIYVPDLVRTGELGPPEVALEALRQLFKRRLIFARACDRYAVPERDRALCPVGPDGALIALAYREPPGEIWADRITPTTPSATWEGRKAS